MNTRDRLKEKKKRGGVNILGSLLVCPIYKRITKSKNGGEKKMKTKKTINRKSKTQTVKTKKKKLSLQEIKKTNPNKLDSSVNYVKLFLPEVYQSLQGKDCQNTGRISLILYHHLNSSIPLNKSVSFID